MRSFSSSKFRIVRMMKAIICSRRVLTWLSGRVLSICRFLSTLASRYVFVHNEVYHKKASVFAKN